MKVTRNFNAEKNSSRIAYLIAGFIRKRLTSVEHDELDAWVGASDDNMELFEELTDEKTVTANLKWLDRFQSRSDLPLSRQSIMFERQRGMVRRIVGWTSAACVLIMAGIFVVNKAFPEKELTENYAEDPASDILPPRNITTLVLGNGSTVNLSFFKNGVVATEFGTNIKKTNRNEIFYDNTGPKTQSLTYNTLSTAKGSEYIVVLPDSSKVWLNAQSSLRYPTQFSTDERQVELNGEAYFEVASKVGDRGNKQPFIVKLSNGGMIKTLAAQYNVSSYENGSNARVTLFQGNAEISKQVEGLQLQPTQQGLFSDSLKLGSNVDLNEVIAWKNGQFIFSDADMESIKREIERWYDVQISGASAITGHFNVTALRSEPLSKLLRSLEATGQVHFKIEHRKISVLR